MSEPASTLEIPTEKDVPLVVDLLQERFEELEDEYVLIPEEPENERQERIMREGSLCQELLAQLSNQGYKRFD